MYFYSENYELQKQSKTCNKKTDGENKNILSYGAIFPCPEKKGNRKIMIDFDDVRLLIERIYYYRKAAIEIFTETKSYYFNFLEEKRMEDFFALFTIPYKYDYIPILIKNEFIGLKKVNPKIIEKFNYFNLINQSNRFIEFFLSYTSKGELCEMCIFDILIMINLLSNRSYNDLHQYPVFPLLFFYDRSKNQLIKRELNTHIGLQTVSDGTKTRANLFKELYNGFQNYRESNEEVEPHFFNTHYSNMVYTCNFLIRLFPYSFLSIESKGDRFDDPNRLFYSIEETFYNISSQKSDLRELIPQFYYMPEIFMNINNINFHERSNNMPVDDLEIKKSH